MDLRDTGLHACTQAARDAGFETECYAAWPCLCSGMEPSWASASWRGATTVSDAQVMRK